MTSERLEDTPPPKRSDSFPSHTSDQSLLRRFMAGDEDAAAQLYRRYAQRLCSLVQARCSPQLAPRLDPEDIVQSAFRSFFRLANTGVYSVPAGEDLWKLLFTITLNKVRAQATFHRAAKRSVEVTTSLNHIRENLDLVDEQEGRDAFLHLVIEETLQQLPPQQREVVELRLQGHEVEAIAQKIGRAKRTVERNLQQALARLRALFEDD